MNHNEKEKKKTKHSPSDQRLGFMDCSKRWSDLKGDFLKEEGGQKIGSIIFLPPRSGRGEEPKSL